MGHGPDNEKLSKVDIRNRYPRNHGRGGVRDGLRMAGPRGESFLRLTLKLFFLSPTFRCKLLSRLGVFAVYCRQDRNLGIRGRPESAFVLPHARRAAVDIVGALEVESHRVILREIVKRQPVSKKVVFVAFAIEDERQRDFLKGQSLNTTSPFEYVDMSVKDPYDSNWKERVRTRIRRSDGVIALVSKNSLSSSGQEWEISCSREENKMILGIWAYKDDRTNLPGVNTKVWSWPTIEGFIDGL